MKHRPIPVSASSTPVNNNNNESRSFTLLNERSRTLDYQNNLALLEEDWNNQQQLSTPSSVSSSLFDICKCCGRQDCDSLEYFNRTTKKLESDTRLAAEIGQGLLHKHETYVNESNQKRNQLEKQLKECHERITGLEYTLDQTENEKDELLKEKNKWLWEYQKRQKIIDETLSDLEMSNEKCNQLSLDLESKSSEVEKLRIFKFMVRHSEAREETLTSKLEDTNQELAVCRKNELVLESKIKKLKMRYESLYNNHEQLTRDVEDKIIKNASSTINVHNNNTHHASAADTIKLVPSITNTTNNTNDLINLIKELSSANTKLKSDLLNCREQLSEARGEVTALTQKIDEEQDSSVVITNLQDDLLPKKRNNATKRAASVKGEKRHKTVENSRSKTIPIPLPTPLPTISSSMPTSATNMMPSSSSFSPSAFSLKSNGAIVHHHYHYYVKNSKGERIQITDEMESNSSNSGDSNGDILLDCCDTVKKNDLYTTLVQEQQGNNLMTLSPSTSSSITTITQQQQQQQQQPQQQQQNPYILLQEHVTQILDRLRGSDIRALNRRLKRAFDITELSSMSNSVIDNILMDVDTLDTRFLWYNNNESTSFFPLLDLIKDMLKELGILRTTMNELQVEYVKKVQESELRVEEEIIKKRQLKKQQTEEAAVAVAVTITAAPLSWLTNMFYKSSNSNNNTIIEDIPPPIPNNTADHDHGSTLTKTTTDSSTLILSPDEDHHPHPHPHLHHHQDNSTSKDDDHNTATNKNTPNAHTIRYNNNSFLSSSANARQSHKKQQTPQMTPSNSSGTNRHNHNVPIIRNKKSLKRMHNNIDYDGMIGPIAIRSSVTSNANTSSSIANFSSSWLGGK